MEQVSKNAIKKTDIFGIIFIDEYKRSYKMKTEMKMEIKLVHYIQRTTKKTAHKQSMTKKIQMRQMDTGP